MPLEANVLVVEGTGLLSGRGEWPHPQITLLTFRVTSLVMTLTPKRGVRKERQITCQWHPGKLRPRGTIPLVRGHPGGWWQALSHHGWMPLPGISCPRSVWRSRKKECQALTQESLDFQGVRGSQWVGNKRGKKTHLHSCQDAQPVSLDCLLLITTATKCYFPFSGVHRCQSKWILFTHFSPNTVKSSKVD